MKKTGIELQQPSKQCFLAGEFSGAELARISRYFLKQDIIRCRSVHEAMLRAAHAGTPVVINVNRTFGDLLQIEREVERETRKIVDSYLLTETGLMPFCASKVKEMILVKVKGGV